MDAAPLPETIPVTVTFLEMTAPPAHYPPLPYHRALALLRTQDIPIHYYRYLIDRVGRKWQWVNALRMSEEALDRKIHGEGVDIRVLYMDGCPAGFFHLTPEANNTVELTYFGMMEQAIGKGVGRWFLGAAVEAAWSKGAQSVLVQTCTLDHPAALPLYQKLGFQPIGQQMEQVRPMSMDERSASVMR